MCLELTEALLRSEKALIPYDRFRGSMQVSAIVANVDGCYIAFEFIDDNEKYLDPIEIRTSILSSEQIEARLSDKNAPYEIMSPKTIHIIRSSFLLEGQPESVIEGIDLFDAEGRILRMRREGAMYAYCLVLQIIEPRQSIS